MVLAKCHEWILFAKISDDSLIPASSHFFPPLFPITTIGNKEEKPNKIVEICYKSNKNKMDKIQLPS